MTSLKRVQFLARNYAALQGLKNLPIWTVALLFGVNLVVGARSAPLPAIAMLLFLLGIGIAPFAYFGIRSYYSRHFGYAQMRANPQDVMYTVLLVIGVSLDDQFKLPVSVFSLFAAIYYVVNWRQAPDLLQHYLVFALLMTLFGLSITLIPIQDRLGIVVIFISIVNLAGSFYDHALLQRLVQHSEEASSYDQSI